MELAVVMEERCICSIFEPPESLCEQQRSFSTDARSCLQTARRWTCGWAAYVFSQRLEPFDELRLVDLVIARLPQLGHRRVHLLVRDRDPKLVRRGLELVRINFSTSIGVEGAKGLREDVLVEGSLDALAGFAGDDIDLELA